jgi:hypothetical protein
VARLSTATVTPPRLRLMLDSRGASPGAVKVRRHTATASRLAADRVHGGVIR